MSQALKLGFAANQVDEQARGSVTANFSKIDFAGRCRSGQLFGHHHRHHLRAGQIERPCELRKARAFGDHDAEDSQPARREHDVQVGRPEEHTSELQSLMRISYAVFCLKTTTIDKNKTKDTTDT